MSADTPDLSNGGKAAWAMLFRAGVIFMAGYGAHQAISTARAASVDALQADVLELTVNLGLVMDKLEIPKESRFRLPGRK